MKDVVIRVAGRDEDHDVAIQAAATAREILDKVGLTGYRLKREASDHWFGDDENVYACTGDGEKLVASQRNEVGISTVG